MKPYYRFNIPQMDILEEEKDLWNRYKENILSSNNLIISLKVYLFFYFNFFIINKFFLAFTN